MKAELLSTWNKFEEKLGELKAKHRERQNSSKQPVFDLLYRGQRKSCWQLETTLDRRVKGRRKMSLEEYYKTIHTMTMKEPIEEYTNKSWDIPTPEAYQKWLKKQEGILKENPPDFCYMTYLRHQEFPSPLLDWTFNPYIAAFFAFKKTDDETKYVSIYILQEWVVGDNYVSTWTPNFYILKENPSTNMRHLKQKSQYTIYTYQEDDELIYYTPHDKITDHKEYVPNMLLKFNIPSTERPNVSKKLDTLNINYLSLFGSEEGSDNDIAIRHFFGYLANKYCPKVTSKSNC